MRSIVILLAKSLKVSCNLLLVLNVKSIAQEFAALLLENRLSIGLNGQITIFDCLHVCYFILLKILSQRIFAGKLLLRSIESQMNEALPTMWSSGTKPQ